MKELKFRAWNCYDNIMILWDDLQLAKEENENIMTYVRNDSISSSERNLRLMEFIGIKDINNKEIYEGDFVKNSNGRIYEVEYCKEHCGFLPFCFSSDDGYEYTKQYPEYCEVIGNKYQNREMLDKVVKW